MSLGADEAIIAHETANAVVDVDLAVDVQKQIVLQRAAIDRDVADQAFNHVAACNPGGGWKGNPCLHRNSAQQCACCPGR
ncbi:MAG: hypothetical protein M1292_09625, partial [Bacteroidetes bacterium]|nr:hypothetical protein [Bacteroidota bacterium]